jgi:hypothetical protein
MSLDMILMDEKVFFLDYITLHIIYIYESTFLIVTPPTTTLGLEALPRYKTIRKQRQ